MPFLTIFWDLNFWFGKISAFKKCKNSSKSKFRASKCDKMADIALQESSKLISRKIWLMQKSWNLHKFWNFTSKQFLSLKYVVVLTVLIGFGIALNLNIWKKLEGTKSSKNWAIQFFFFWFRVVCHFQAAVALYILNTNITHLHSVKTSEFYVKSIW